MALHSPETSASVLLAALERRAAAHPGRAAVRSPRGVLAVGELWHAIEGEARELGARRELRRGAIVALAAANGAPFLIGWGALLRAGLTPLLVDPGTPDGELARIARRLGAAAVWRRPAERASGHGAARPARELLLLDAGDDAPLIPGAAALMLTSGSSGEPAAVVKGARELAADAAALWAAFGLIESDRLLALVPMSHSYGHSLLAMPALLHGCELVVPEGEDPLVAARELGASVLPSVPSWYQAELARADLDWPPSLARLVSAGAPLSPRVAREFRERHGVAIGILYGASECGAIACDRTGSAGERGRVGRPLPGVEVELVRPERRGVDSADPEGATEAKGAEWPEGAGLVSVRSAAVARATWPPGTDGCRITGGRFASDDVARFEDGELELVGRRGAWINVKGKKVDPREVEVVLEALPGVREAAVVGAELPDGAGESVRAVVAAEAGALGWTDVFHWCRARLAPHKVPRSVIVVTALPRNERGKLDRRALLALRPPGDGEPAG